MCWRGRSICRRSRIPPRRSLTPQGEDGRAALWTLARFAEYAGVGQGTTYGFGRVRVLRGEDRWSRGQRLSAWDRER